ncbi:MAG: twitching motility protein PilT [Meiothermus sp.]|nr:MAG: twitching motility protein PilT [Meiothermus sp.]
MSLESANIALQKAREMAASDLLFGPNMPPAVKVGGVYRYLPLERIGVDELWQILETMFPEWQVKNFRERAQKKRSPEDAYVSFSGTESRYRVQVSWTASDAERDLGEVIAPVISLRLIPKQVWAYRDLGLPDQLVSMTSYDAGLILVVGPTDSGKTTTLVSLVEHLNAEETRYILMVEKPIEYRITPRRGIVFQREVPLHVSSMPEAVHTALRSNVDVVVLGEMRQPEEYKAALEAAETGHLVLASMHAPGVIEAVERIVQSMPDQKLAAQILGNTLLGVIAQRLIPTGDSWRAMAYEFLVMNTRARQHIKAMEFDKLYQLMATSGGLMTTLEMSVAELVRRRKIAQEVGRFFVNREDVFNELLRPVS